MIYTPGPTPPKDYCVRKRGGKRLRLQDVVRSDMESTTGGDISSKFFDTMVRDCKRSKPSMDDELDEGIVTRSKRKRIRELVPEMESADQESMPRIAVRRRAN